MENAARIGDKTILRGARNLILDLKSGEFPMDRLPNSSNVSHRRLEHEDYLRYERRIGGRLFSYILPEPMNKEK